MAEVCLRAEGPITVARPVRIPTGILRSIALVNTESSDLDRDGSRRGGCWSNHIIRYDRTAPEWHLARRRMMPLEGNHQQHVGEAVQQHRH